MFLIESDMKQLMRKFLELTIGLFYSENSNNFIEILKLISIRFVSSLISENVKININFNYFTKLLSIIFLIIFIYFTFKEFINKKKYFDTNIKTKDEYINMIKNTLKIFSHDKNN